MRLGHSDIASHPRLSACVREQAATLLAIQQTDPRTASIFATQQRWLMAHVALMLCFRQEEAGGLNAAKVVDAIVAHGVASRNTADAFLREMRQYGYLVDRPVGDDRRARPFTMSSVSRDAIFAWLAVHLRTLDGLDGGGRCAALMATPKALGRIHPLIADGLLASAAIREPASSFSLFTWLNEGGIVMDWLYVGLATTASGEERIASTVVSFADIGDRIHLSRTHLARKLRMAEAMGSLGWEGARGKSTMWVSADFVRQYDEQQAAKLAIIDSAFHEVFVS